MQSGNHFRDAALAYARRGWHVVRIAPGRKVPNTPHGVHDATTDVEVIERWWSDSPNSNVAIATGEISGLLVVDLDDLSALTSLEGYLGMYLRDTRVVRSPRGVHLYFKYPYFWEGKIGNTQCQSLKIDTRGNGGMIVAPPSVVNGRMYQLVTDVDPVDIPYELLEMLYPRPKARMRPMHAPRGAPHNIQGLVRTVASAQEGSRNNVLFWAACRAVENCGGTLPIDVARQLIEAGEQAGLATRECERTVASAEKRAGGCPI